MRRVYISAALLLSTLVGGTGNTDDFEYVSNEELSAEIERRKSDVERTEERIVALQTEHLSGVAELDDAAEHVEIVEEMVAVRAKVFYRVSRQGKTLKYLMESDSPVQALKRFNQLEHLLRNGIEDRLRASMRLERAKSNVSRIETEILEAHEFIKMLDETLAELRKELRARDPL